MKRVDLKRGQQISSTRKRKKKKQREREIKRRRCLACSVVMVTK